MPKNDFQTAINLIRSGETDQGLELLEKSSAPETIKNIAKAEIAYYRDDLKNAMYFDEHSLPADHQWYDPLIVNHHLRAYVYAAKKTGSISRAIEFLDYYIAQKRKEYGYAAAKPFENIYLNAMRRLNGQKTTDAPKKIKIITPAECQSTIIFENNGCTREESARIISSMLMYMWNTIETEKVLKIYEEYADLITLDDHHIWAARNYIKLHDDVNALTCLMRYAKGWTPTEKFTVMPMKVFVFNDILKYWTPEIRRQFLVLNKNR